MPPQPKKRGRATLWMLLLLAAAGIGFAAGWYGVHFYDHDNTPPEPAAALRSSGVLDKVVALGRIEPKDGVLSLGVPTPDRISYLKVSEGAEVAKGQVLAILDSAALRELERSLAVIQREQAEQRLKAVTASGKAQIRVEEARREQVEKVEPIEIKALESKITFLQAQEENAQKDYQRYLAAGDTIAQQDKEKQRLLRNQVRAELIAAQCQRDKLVKSGELNRSLADAQLEAAKAELTRGQSAISLELLDKQIEQANERLKETELRAPSAGKILRIMLREGELVQGQPILQMANTHAMIALTEVYETDIERVRVNDKATITSHIFKGDNALTGRVVWKGSSIGRARVIALDPRAAADNRVVDVKVELDQPERVADLIGHQVRVEIATSPER
jgi:HlyD family secretion protein